MIFRVTLESHDFVKVWFSDGKITIFKGSSMKTTWRNPQKNHAKFEVKKKRPKCVQKSDLGGSWALFGRGWGGSWALLGYSWAPLGRFLVVQKQFFFKHGTNISSKKPFECILGRFGEGLGGFGGGQDSDFGRDSEGFRAFSAGSHRSLVIEPTWERFENFSQTIH